MKKIFVSVAAAGVLVAGAFAASTIIETPAEAQTVATDEAEAAERPNFARSDEILDEVLTDLVALGTLEQSEADVVATAFASKHEQVRAEMEAWREENLRRSERGFERGFRMGGLLEDGVIDADELAELPDDHPLKDADGPAAEYLADGQLTEDELKQMGEQFRQRRAGDRSASTDA